jgi:hypothetical protein
VYLLLAYFKSVKCIIADDGFLSTSIPHACNITALVCSQKEISEPYPGLNDETKYTYILSLWSTPIPESRLSSECRELSNSDAIESGFAAVPNEEKSPPRA